MELYQAAVDVLRMFMLLVGSAVIFIGIARGLLEARGAGGRGRVARRIATHASLGLEFFVGATILNLILRPTALCKSTEPSLLMSGKRLI